MQSITLLAMGAMLMQQPPASAPPGKTAPPARNAKAPSTAATKPAATRPVQATATKEPVTDEEKTIYAVGLSIGRSLKSLSLSPAELQLVQSAISDSLANKPAVPLEAWGPKIQALAETRGKAAAEATKAASQSFLEKTATEPNVVKTPSGLIYKEVQAGTGASPKATDTVNVNYRGTLIDGTEFDSSYKRNEPASFALNSVIPCWTEGLQMMKSGGKARLVCPSSIAYGDRGNQGIPGGAALIFEVELLSVQSAGQ